MIPPPWRGHFLWILWGQNWRTRRAYDSLLICVCMQMHLSVWLRLLCVSVWIRTDRQKERKRDAAVNRGFSVGAKKVRKWQCDSQPVRHVTTGVQVTNDQSYDGRWKIELKRKKAQEGWTGSLNAHKSVLSDWTTFTYTIQNLNSRINPGRPKPVTDYFPNTAQLTHYLCTHSSSLHIHTHTLLNVSECIR